MAVEIANAVINLTPSLRGMGREIERQVRGVDTRRAGERAGGDYSSGFSGAAKKITGILAASFAAVKIKDFAVSAIGQASDLVEAGTKLQAIFGAATPQIEAFGAKGAKALGQSNLAAKNAAASFGVFGKAAGLAAKDNAKFSTELAGLATDLASFYNTSPEDAVTAIAAGLRGESEPLRQYGVLLDDATLRQEALKQGLIATTKQALTPQQRVLAAHAVIMKQTQLAQGDFARTSKGLANQQRILSAQWTDMKGKLGAVFLPAVTSVVSGLNEKLFPALGKIQKVASKSFEPLSKAAHNAYGGLKLLFTSEYDPKHFEGIEEDGPIANGLLNINRAALSAYGGLEILVKGDYNPKHWAAGIEEDSAIVNGLFNIREGAISAGTALKDHLVSGFQTVSPILSQVGKILGPAIVKVFDALGPVFQQLGPALSGLLPLLNPLGAIFKSMLPVLPVIAQVVGDIAVVIAQGLAQALQAVMPLINAISSAFKQILPVFAQLVQSLMPPLMELFQSFTPLIKAVFDAVVPLISQLAKFLVPVIKSLLPVIKAVVQGVGPIIKDFIKIFDGLIQFITAVFKGDWSKAWEAIKKVFSTIWESLKKIVTVVWDGIKGAIMTVWNTVLKPLWEKVIQPAIEALGRFFSGLGRVVASVWDGIKQKILEIWNWLNDHIFKPIGTVLSTVGGFFANLGRGVATAWDGIKKKIREVWTWLDEHVFVPIGIAFSAVQTAVGALWSGVKGAWDAVKGFFSTIKEAINEAWTFITDIIEKIGTAISDFFSKEYEGKPVSANPGAAGTPEARAYYEAHGNLNNWDFAHNRPMPGYAYGGVVPGSNLGRYDNQVIRARGREAVMVPEFTNAVGGERGVHAINRAAESGLLDQYLPGYARGGVISNLPAAPKWDQPARDSVSQIVGHAAGELATTWWVGLVPGWGLTLSQMAETFKAGKPVGNFYQPPLPDTSGGGVGGVDSGLLGNQDPSSFGWTRGGPVSPYQFQGHEMVGGLATGTLDLWDQLLSRVVPLIQGGIVGEMYGYENRDNVNNPGVASFHAYGLAGDINAPWNANGSEPGTGLYQIPPAAGPIAKALGFLWGGDFNGTKDPMHFELHRARGALGGGGGAGSSALVEPSANVLTREQFDSLAKAVMVAAGFNPVDSYIMTNQAQHESDFRRNAINLTDSNAAAGHPSQGPLQFTPGTFDAFHRPGYDNFLGYIDQMFAFLRYVPATYSKYNSSHQGLGYLEQIGFGPYDNGGMFPPGLGVNMLKKPEAVLTPKQTEDHRMLAQYARELAHGEGSGHVVEIHIDGGDEISQIIARTAKVTVDGEFVDFRRNLTVAAGQSR